MRTVQLPGGETVPVLGLGTWRMGENSSRLNEEVSAVRHALDRGVTLIDTAEMYGEGGVEEVIGEAVRGRRDGLFIVSKVYPYNARYDDVLKACERSLKRMDTDRIDLYLLHWRGSVPFAETLEAFQALCDAGKIRYFGVSNFDSADMAEWCSAPGGEATASNQILYNLSRRGVEWDILPGCRERGIPVMAYSPLEQGRLNAPVLRKLAEKHGATPMQVALAWVLAQPEIIAIPKTANAAHLDQNLAALDIQLDTDDHAALDAAYPPPDGPSHLEML